MDGDVDNLLSFLFFFLLAVTGQGDEFLLLIARSLATCANHCDDVVLEVLCG